MIDYEEELKETIRRGERKQDIVNPQKYRYRMAFTHLPVDNTHVVAIVLFLFRDEAGKIASNNYIVTAYPVEMG